MAKAKVVSRFVKLSATGRELSVRAKNWPYVLDRETRLIWTAEPVLDARAPWEKAIAAANAVKLNGKKLHAPSIKEQLTLVDYGRCNPAIDTRFFRIPSAWFWTSTPMAGSASSNAWLVSFGDGDAYYSHRSYEGFVLAVCSARASQ